MCSHQWLQEQKWHNSCSVPWRGITYVQAFRAVEERTLKVQNYRKKGQNQAQTGMSSSGRRDSNTNKWPMHKLSLLSPKRKMIRSHEFYFPSFSS